MSLLLLLLQAVTLKVECTKLTCPALVNCSESEAYRPDPMACCKQCPTATTTPSPAASAAAVTASASVLAAAAAGLLGEEAMASGGGGGREGEVRGEADVLAAGGCRFKGDVFDNGEEWHPRIQPWGEMKCINCNCKVPSTLYSLPYYQTPTVYCMFKSQLTT